ncbi:MAG: ATP-binding protein [Paracoccaceae bacterium]|nr:ATP-binding protein [Paracoccaceae bacterium]
MPGEKKFRISSALKDIIGRELITNDFIAIFELVKNSFDAHSRRVDIIFEGLTLASPKLVIKDNGKGMDHVDLEKKWLFVAYSAKEEGTEDYRDKIQSNRTYAGAKGIGRFSCDRLGKHLTIYTRKKVNAPINKLEVHWEDFESDVHKEFIDIPVSHSTTPNSPYELSKGTILDIAGLREQWDRKKLLELKRSLEKIINPNQENDPRGFSVYLKAPDEARADKGVSVDEAWNKVNGKVENLVFEDIGFKTTKIRVQVTDDGEKIITRLEDRGHLIYEIAEKNPYSSGGEKLGNIDIHLFAMNGSAKNTFTRRMGIRVVEYGSVFVYKNGFRIHPFGDVVGGDVFAIDRRKQQQGSRVLGTREILGRVEINGANKQFQETSSRDGGLIKNQQFEHLQDLFFTFALKRLEKFAIGVIKFGEVGSEFNYGDIDRSEALDLILSLTKSDKIIDFTYDEKMLDILNEISENSLQGVLKNFKSIVASSGNSLLETETRKVERRLNELQRAKEDAEKSAEISEKERREAEKLARKEAVRARHAEQEAKRARAVAEKKTTQNLFLKSIVSQDVENIVSLHHHVGIAAGAIENYVKNITRRIKTGKSITPDTLLSNFEKISYQAKKILSTTRFATKANFSLEATKITRDICEFIKEYVENVCTGLIKTSNNRDDMVFTWSNKKNIKHTMEFRPMELAIVLDNLISNSRKALANEVRITVESAGDGYINILIQDDGKGIKKEAMKNIFDLAYTTTSGSGLGLYQVRKIMEEIKGSISYVDGIKGGAGFELKFRS